MVRDRQITESTAKTMEDVGKMLLDLAQQVRWHGVALLEAKEVPFDVAHVLPTGSLLQFPTGKRMPGSLECLHGLAFQSFGFWLAQCPYTTEFFFKPEENPAPPNYRVVPHTTGCAQGSADCQ